MTQQIIFKVDDGKKRAFRMRCLAQGVTMKAVLTRTVDEMIDGRPSEVDDLVTALRNILAECTNPRAAYGKRVNEMCREALAPFQDNEGDK